MAPPPSIFCLGNPTDRDFVRGVETDCADKGTDRQRGKYKQTVPQRRSPWESCERAGLDLVTK